MLNNYMMAIFVCVMSIIIPVTGVISILAKAILICLAIVLISDIHITRMLKFFRRLWPFVLKRTAAKQFKILEEAAIQAERNRIIHMKYDDLFEDLPEFEYTRFPEIETSGAALIDPSGNPVSIKKFSCLRSLIKGDQIILTV
jgi:hypothetical protein